ncbi:MAG: restriction endonuclease [candidate division Zixibacteria bacterium]|nr:restriction endonuclease [candidate division Zixibacteria bacterium]
MAKKIIAYTDFCDYTVVENPTGIFPPNGEKYFGELIKCPYCSSPISFDKIKDHMTKQGYDSKIVNDKIPSFSGNWCQYSLELCLCTNSNCGWWALEQIVEQLEYHRTEVEIKWGQIKTFDISSREIPIRLIRDEIKKRPNMVYSTHHDSFERLMADCLRDKFPGSFVKHVGKSGDRGIDIYCVIDDEECLVQVKRHKNGSISEGPKAIRELNGVLLREGIYKGIFISTAKRFTEAAFGELKIKMETQKPVIVELIAFDGIIDLVSRNFEKYEPWKNYIVKV